MLKYNYNLIFKFKYMACDKKDYIVLPIETNKPIDKNNDIKSNLDTIENRITERLKEIDSTWKMYSYEKNRDWTYNIVINWLKYEAKNYNSWEKLINAIKIIEKIISIYLSNWNKTDTNKNEFYSKADMIMNDFIDIKINNRTILPDTTILTYESFIQNFWEKKDINNFVNFMNKVVNSI